MKIKSGCCIPGGSYVPGMRGGNESDGKNAAHKLTDTYDRLLETGFDFAEGTASLLFNLTEKEFGELEAAHRGNAFSLYSVNSLLPVEYGLFVNNADEARREYIKKLMYRLAAVGGVYAVFGSGRARSAPEGTVYPQRELTDFLRMCDKEAEANGLTFLIEPLNGKETNLILTRRDGECLIAGTGLEHTALVCDSYHHFAEEPERGFTDGGLSLIKHVHLSEYPGRKRPGATGGEKESEFIAELLAAGYSGGFSVECLFDDYLPEMASAYRFMRKEFAKYE